MAHRPRRAQRPHRRRPDDRSPTGVFSPGAGGLPRGQRLRHRAEPRGGEGADRRLQEVDRRDRRCRWSSAAPREPITAQASELIQGYWSRSVWTPSSTPCPRTSTSPTRCSVCRRSRSTSGAATAARSSISRTCGGTAGRPLPTAQLALNFGRLSDPTVDADLATARSDPDPAKRKAAAEDINRTFAKQCYQIPLTWAIWATASQPGCQGLRRGHRRLTACRTLEAGTHQRRRHHADGLAVGGQVSPTVTEGGGARRLAPPPFVVSPGTLRRLTTGFAKWVNATCLNAARTWLRCR